MNSFNKQFTHSNNFKFKSIQNMNAFPVSKEKVYSLDYYGK